MSNRNPQLRKLIDDHDAEYALAQDPKRQGTERVMNLGYIGVDWPAIREHLLALLALLEGGS